MDEQTKALAEFIDTQIEDRVQLIRDAQQNMEVLQYQIELMKIEIGELLQQKGAGWSDAAGYARITSEKISHTYDTRALDELILKEPLRYGWLGDFRKMATIRGGVQVK